MNTYMIDTNTAGLLALDGDREAATAWFEANLPGDEVSELREALIEAAVRLTGEDRALLDANGFEVSELPLAYTEADADRVFGEGNVFDGSRDGIYNALAAECQSQDLTDGYTSVWETLTVLEEIGGDVEKFIN